MNVSLAVLTVLYIIVRNIKVTFSLATSIRRIMQQTSYFYRRKVLILVSSPKFQTHKRCKFILVFSTSFNWIKRKTYHFRRDLGDHGSDWFSGPPVVGHLELDRVPDLEVLDVSVELRKVEKQTSLPIAALDKAVRMLKMTKEWLSCKFTYF